MAVIPKEYERLAKWIKDTMIREIRRIFRDIGKFAGKNIDKVAAELKKAGLPLPAGFDRLSSDQKIAAVILLGPAGISMLITGNVTAQALNNVLNEYNRNQEKFARELNKIFERAGIPQNLRMFLNPADQARAVEDEARRLAGKVKLFGLDGLGMCVVDTPQRPLGHCGCDPEEY